MKKHFLVALLSLIILSAGALLGAASSAQPPVYLRQWGTQGSGDGQFLYPFAVAVDDSGHVYVADRDNNRIQMFGPGAISTKATNWGHLKALYR